MKKIIKVNNLQKRYIMGEVIVNALRDVSFEIDEGDFVVILGPSGSGKSTLINLIGAMDEPTEGEVFLMGEKVDFSSDKILTDIRRNKIGFVFQFYNLMSNLTAKENIELATEITTDHLNIDDVIKAVGLWERRDHFPSQLSGGEQQRVAIARAVSKNPDILLCDEPTGALDFETGKEILKLLVDVNRKYNKTILVITHNTSIGEIGNKVIKMRSGKVIDFIVNENPIEPEGIDW
ncbi:MAG: ABC transporter ATP-binding protein [Firmicutes bacterium]|jgi:putative ABC transport system ATP-binding protein|nr:ABC transporter ATP-binding protein [Bacillota bacterium]